MKPTDKQNDAKERQQRIDQARTMMLRTQARIIVSNLDRPVLVKILKACGLTDEDVKGVRADALVNMVHNRSTGVNFALRFMTRVGHDPVFLAWDDVKQKWSVKTQKVKKIVKAKL